MAAGGGERIIVCATPWHEDDLAGRLLARAEEVGEEWVVIRFPAVKDNEDLARSVGVSPMRIKIWAFVIGTILIALSGSLFAHYFRVLSPVTFGAAETFRCLTMLVVGGMGTVAGPLVGSLVR